MNTRRIRKSYAALPEGEARHGVRELLASLRPPRRSWPVVRLAWGRIGLWLMLLVGIVVQVIVVALVYELVDLTISLMEVWAELARKHLELTLT